jgi:hypothetical protein
MEHMQIWTPQPKTERKKMGPQEIKQELKQHLSAFKEM